MSSAEVSSDTQARTDTARRRLEAIVEGLSPPSEQAASSSSSSSSASSSNNTLPTIKTVATLAPNPRVKDRVIIITGANSITGIGRAAAHQFAANGARAVYACDFTDDNLSTHKKEIESLYPHCTVHPVQIDVGSDTAVESLVNSAVETYGRLDVMFANAGIGGFPSTFDNITADEYMEIMRVNALGVFLCFKYAAMAMKKSIESGKQVGASLIGTASVAGLRSNAGGTPYSASKAAVISMAQTFAYQLTGTGIRANAICPGLIETGMTQPMFDMARERGNERKLGQLNPTKRGGIADEIARVALFLGSDEASYVNGQAWAVCGGLSAGHPFVPGKIA